MAESASRAIDGGKDAMWHELSARLSALVSWESFEARGNGRRKARRGRHQRESGDPEGRGAAQAGRTSRLIPAFCARACRRPNEQLPTAVRGEASTNQGPRRRASRTIGPLSGGSDAPYLSLVPQRSGAPAPSHSIVRLTGRTLQQQPTPFIRLTFAVALIAYGQRGTAGAFGQDQPFGLAADLAPAFAGCDALLSHRSPFFRLVQRVRPEFTLHRSPRGMLR
jgi:hypothetical protein